MLKRPNLLKDALYNVRTSSGACDEYVRGLVVGVVATLMAATGGDFESIVPTVVEHLPVSFRPDRLPPAFRDAFVEEFARQLDAKRKV